MYSFWLILLYAFLLAIKPSRKLALALTPWLVFACSYDWMRLLPNYTVNPIDVRGLYETEKHLFGITTAAGARLIPGEYFALHHSAVADFMAGLFYLCWVPVPLGFSIFLYFKGDRHNYLRISLAFLFVNLLGFVIYYIHPAAPPWYVMNYGFEPILNTPGSTAGLERFDELTGLPVFHYIYGKNANIFAAVPSLHAAYMLITTIYAVLSRRSKLCVCIFAFICMGIWWTAVYTGHHYVIDVLLGIVTALVGVGLLEWGAFRIPALRRGLKNYEENI